MTASQSWYPDSGGPSGGGASGRQARPRRRWVAPTVSGAVCLLLGTGMGAATAGDPTASTEYQNLSASLVAWENALVVAEQQSAAAAPAPLAAAPAPAPAPAPAAPATDPRFGTCAEARRNGYGSYVKGVDPEYDWYRDADKDGVVCE